MLASNYSSKFHYYFGNYSPKLYIIILASTQQNFIIILASTHYDFGNYYPEKILFKILEKSGLQD